MKKDIEITEKTEVKQKSHLFQKGVSGNPAGRPKGSLDFKTKFYNVIDKLAKQNNISAEEVEEQLMLVGYKKAKEGDFGFYRDLMDRLHGKPINRNEISGVDGKELKIIFDESFKK